RGGGQRGGEMGPGEARAAGPQALEPIQPAARAALDAAAKRRTAEIVRQMAARRQQTAQLLKDNEQLRRELSTICLASEGIRTRAKRLVSLARAAGGRY